MHIDAYTAHIKGENDQCPSNALLLRCQAQPCHRRHRYATNPCAQDITSLELPRTRITGPKQDLGKYVFMLMPARVGCDRLANIAWSCMVRGANPLKSKLPTSKYSLPTPKCARQRLSSPKSLWAIFVISVSTSEVHFSIRQKIRNQNHFLTLYPDKYSVALLLCLGPIFPS